MRSADSALASFLRVLATVARILGCVLCLAVVLLSFSVGPLRPVVVAMQSLIQSLIPAFVRGAFVVPTPLGGAFRGDFAIFAVLLFLLDWALVRASERVGR